MKVELRPTIAADLPHVIGEPLPFRIKATTVLVDGQVVGLGGLGFLPDGTVVAFAQMIEGAAKKYPIALHRTGLRMIADLEQSSIRCVLAEARRSNPAAARWLLRLGFEPLLTPRGDPVIANDLQTFIWKRRDVERPL